jgi:mono/diheme cytochrome c family protein
MRTALFLLMIGLVMATTSTATGQSTNVERGKYLVEQVGRCQECHTPKTDTGELDKSQWMKGATLIAVPSAPVADWHQKSPDITSTSALWTRWGQDGFSKFLQTARNPRGGKAGPPMPAYMLQAEDADAIAAYLKSLP